MKIKCLLLASALMFSGGSFALNQTDLKNLEGYGQLTKEQQLLIQQEIVKMTPQVVNGVEVPTTEHIDQWVEVGDRIGKMLTSTAKELGVAANEFVHTPIGRVAFFVGLWYLFGNQVMHLTFGIIILLVCMRFIRRIQNNMMGDTIEYSADKVDVFGRARKVKEQIHNLDGEQITGIAIMYILSILSSCIIVFSHSSL